MSAVGRLSEGKRTVGDVGRREKAARKSTRTTLINPQGISWPDPPERDAVELLHMIKKSIKCLKPPNKKVPRSVVKNVPKGRRGAARKEWTTQNAAEVGFDVVQYMSYRTSLCLGVNCVSRALDIDILAAVVIEKNVNPEVITKMLVPLAVNKGIPILSVTGLSTVFEEMVDVRCIAFGLKKECATVNSHFFSLCELLKDMYAKNFLVEDEIERETESLTVDTVQSDSLRSTEESDSNSEHLSTVANATQESLNTRCRRLSLTVEEEMESIKETALSSQAKKQPTRKRNSKSNATNKPFVPAKVRKVTSQLQ